MEAYREETRSRALTQIDDVVKELPAFMRRFANEYLVVKNKSPRTVLGYVTDIRIFLRFIADYKDIRIKDISYDILESITVDDMQDYFSYLLKYETHDETTGKKAVFENEKHLYCLTGYVKNEKL